MLNSFRVLRRRLVRIVSSDSSSEAVHSELSAWELHVGLFTSGQFALVEALVTSRGAEEFVKDGDASAGSKVPACAQHVANVYTFSGDRSGLLMSFHLSVSR